METGKSTIACLNSSGVSNNKALADLTFDSIPIKRIVVPKTLFDDRVPVDRDRLLLFLPLIVCRSGDGLVIVDGCKRFKARGEDGRECCPCGILGPDQDLKLVGLLRIKLNSGRSLHPREKLLFIRWLKENLDAGSYQQTVLELGLQPGERRDYEKMLSCSPVLVEAVVNGILDLSVAPEMSHLPETDATALITLFSSLAFSRQMQRELVEWLHEIAFFSKSGISEILASQELSGALAHPTLNAPQKIARFHELVYARRFPLYSKTKKAWIEQAHEVNPNPARVSFRAGPFFEKNDLEIRIRAGSAIDAKESLEKLALIPASSWQKLIDPATLL
ncbi:MAG: hypothetical protein JXA71_06145 [Chitinispirillaceae bacterium]|nr:hypothetical protein [Chitinispirillaceae bacterium]